MTVAVMERITRVRTRKSSIGYTRSLDYHEKIPNAETLAAMQEVEDMIGGKIPKNPQSLNNFFEELGINVDRKLFD